MHAWLKGFLHPPGPGAHQLAVSIGPMSRPTAILDRLLYHGSADDFFAGDLNRKS